MRRSETLPIGQARLEAAKALADERLAELGAGVSRAQHLGPGLVRLARWRWSRWVRALRSASALSVCLPIAAGLSTTVACNALDPSGGLNGFTPELAKAKRAEREKARWSYVLPIDHGVRADEEGEGYFRAPRFHGEHNGIDLLAPVGTQTFSACDGFAMASVSGSFGKTVHLICPVPTALVDSSGPEPWVSLFYAHLDKLELPLDVWTGVSPGQLVGTVGKSGNARGPLVQPHLHLELIVQRNRRAAMDELHLGKDQSGVRAADYFSSALEKTCLVPNGFQPKNGQVARARRLDPFVVLTCLSQEKPNFRKAPVPLDAASNAWSDFYVAKNFNVDLGPDDERRR